MSVTTVRVLQSAIVSSGVLEIKNIGAGVGVIVFSPEQKTAAGIHIMAPSAGAIIPKNPVMYADTAIPYLVGELKKKGVVPPLSVALAGGAAPLGEVKGAAIGLKVVEAVRIALQKVGLSAKVEKTGGSLVRSMVLDIDAGKIKVT